MTSGSGWPPRGWAIPRMAAQRSKSCDPSVYMWTATRCGSIPRTRITFSRATTEAYTSASMAATAGRSRSFPPANSTNWMWTRQKSPTTCAAVRRTTAPGAVPAAPGSGRASRTPIGTECSAAMVSTRRSLPTAHPYATGSPSSATSAVSMSPSGRTTTSNRSLRTPAPRAGTRSVGTGTHPSSSRATTPQSSISAATTYSNSRSAVVTGRSWGRT